jgi:hypothetical protein
MTLIRDSKGGEKSSKWQFGKKILLGNVITSRNHHKKDLMMVMRLQVGASLLEAS